MSPQTPGPADPGETRRLLDDLPKEVAALLISVGALGMVMPGMVGVPAVVAGGLVFWPKTFGPLEGWLGRRFPRAHRQSLDQIRRYLRDLEHRYPNPTGRVEPTRPETETQPSEGAER